jgi:hypothetical protein
MYLKSYDAAWRNIEVEGYTQSANKNTFPFSKPSPFSSMTDWQIGNANKQ